MCRFVFMAMKAETCMKPGYTRRPAPLCRFGTVAMRFFSNQSIGLEVASAFTPVGLMRQSTGPAISVMLRGAAASRVCAITPAAMSACTAGWQTARMCDPSPMVRRKRTRWAT